MDSVALAAANDGSSHTLRVAQVFFLYFFTRNKRQNVENNPCARGEVWYSQPITETKPTMKQQLQAMKIGFTKVINGIAVTRWSEDKFEVGTWGRKTQSIDDAISALM